MIELINSVILIIKIINAIMQCILTKDYFSRAVDIWAIGCLVGEVMTGDPIFPGKSDIDQLYRVMKHLGKL